MNGLNELKELRTSLWRPFLQWLLLRPRLPRILLADKRGKEIEQTVQYEGLDRFINTGYRNSDA